MQITGNAQSGLKTAKGEMDTVLVNTLLQQSKEYLTQAPDKAIALANRAMELSQKWEYLKGEAFALKNLGLVFYFQGKYIQTLQYWNESLKKLQQINDKDGIANLMSNIGAVYANQGDDVNALSYHLKALKLAEQTGNTLRIVTALNNIADIYFDKKATWDKALEYLLRAYPLAKEVGNKESEALILGNIGEIYFGQGDDDKALTYYKKALDLGSTENTPFAYNGLGKVYLRQGDSEKSLYYHTRAFDIAQKSNEIQLVPALQGIAANFVAKKDYRSAIVYYKKSEDIAVKQNSFPRLNEIYDRMAATYAGMGDFANAFKYQKKLDQVKDTLFNEITERKLGTLQFEFDLQKKVGEINLLTKDKVLQELQLKKQRFAKNAFAVGLVLVFIISFVLLRNYRIKVKTNKMLDHQKAEIESLLLNVLPSEVATELKANGYSKPRYFEQVSVMFSDIKDFTSISEHLSPEVLVEELSTCFMAFDNIIEKYGLEKIKTIGDCYMCAGGIPVSNEQHAYNIVKAALEIQDYIYLNNLRRAELGLVPWEIRIGIHVGPVIAGVVGKKKYAYDIWGTTVNIASRMESSGVPGKINISAATFELIKDRYACIYRGKVHAKNVGDVDMYLIDHELDVKLEKENRKTETGSAIFPSIIPG
jgi:class 3 adenylate cyclase/tetratricopeptide (TPR) repeat protein